MSHTKLPLLSGRELIRALAKIGYVVLRQHGSHIRLAHPGDSKRKKLTVPDHKILGRGLLRKILRDAEVSVEEFNKLL
ncbi:MAG: type II toxin-antitoxin system HicA family toxin [Candidatus Altiarchaeota archaeon]